MGDFSNWYLLADRDNYYLDELDYDGPACYELGIKEPGDYEPYPVYVGETGNLSARMESYAVDGSHLSDPIDYHLDQGFTLYFRFIPVRTKEFAKRLEKKYLDEIDYDWNLQNN